MGCYRCGQGLHFECGIVNGAEKCCGDSILCTNPLAPVGDDESSEPKKLKDPESTIRKEAARLYPLERSSPCDWQRSANVGGGLFPIVGCINGTQDTIHHGPEKIPRNGSVVYRTDADRINTRGNVHRICERCHHLWHAWNDAVYVAEGPFTPPLPREATNEELMLWDSSKTRPKPPVARAGSFVPKGDGEE